MASSPGGAGQGLGGGVFNLNGTLNVTNGSLANNTAAQGGGGIYNLGLAGIGTVRMSNSILAGTFGGATDDPTFGKGIFVAD